MKILIGITRRVVGDNVTWLEQRSADTWEVEVPDDGREFLSSIWMMTDGFEVLRLPLSMGPLMTNILSGNKDL